MNDVATAATPAELIRKAASDLGVTMSAVFVPFSTSRNAAPRNGQDKPWQSLNWKVTLERNGRAFLTTDYSAGIGHAPSANAKAPRTFHGSDSWYRAHATEWEIEHGYAARWSWGAEFKRALPAKPLMPEIEAVLSSLVLDSGVLDYPGFEAWADEYGYDADSRTAEATWRECLNTALQLRAAIGDAGIEALRTACEDY